MAGQGLCGAEHRPKDQRHTGYFATPEAAADEVLKYLCTGVPPPKPERERRKRGEAPRPPAKRQKAAQQASPATPLAELPAQPVTPATLAELGVYTAPCYDGEAPGAPTVVTSALDTMYQLCIDVYSCDANAYRR